MINQKQGWKNREQLEKYILIKVTKEIVKSNKSNKGVFYESWRWCILIRLYTIYIYIYIYIYI